VSHAGAYGRANVGISNDNSDENSGRRKPKVSLSSVRHLRVSRPLRRG
jgi:hypothetical protein